MIKEKRHTDWSVVVKVRNMIAFERGLHRSSLRQLLMRGLGGRLKSSRFQRPTQQRANSYFHARLSRSSIWTSKSYLHIAITISYAILSFFHCEIIEDSLGKEKKKGEEIMEYICLVICFTIHQESNGKLILFSVPPSFIKDVIIIQQLKATLFVLLSN